MENALNRPLSFPALGALACTLLLLAGCATKPRPRHETNRLPAEIRTALFQAESSRLYSLEPAAERDAEGGFHGFKVLGATALGKAETAKVARIVDAQVTQWRSIVARCFLPRHGLRVIHRGTTYDLLICYQCSRIQIDQGEERLTNLRIANEPEPLNALLKRHRLPLAKPNR